MTEPGCWLAESQRAGFSGAPAKILWDIEEKAVPKSGSVFGKVTYSLVACLVLGCSACAYYLSIYPIGDTVSMARSHILKNLKEKDGKYVIQVFYKSGGIRLEREYIIDSDGVPIQHGVETHWNPDGTIDRQIFWSDGARLN